jgi:5-(carboxyamino)imidazole ribonucleotide synthase
MKIGILGAGQLAKMLALAGYPLGIEFAFYAFGPEPKSSVAPIWRHQANANTLQDFMHSVDVITYETENIDSALLAIIAENKPVFPSLEALLTSQDRLQEKALFEKLDIPTTHYIPIDSVAELTQAAQQLSYPFFIKQRSGGYDGKGQQKIDHAEQLQQQDLSGLCKAAIVEAAVPFTQEVSMVATRDQKGTIVYYDLSVNQHQQGILVYAHNLEKHPALTAMARHYMQQVLMALDYVGTLAIEFFVCENQLIANEMSPRVHNSGHWTMQAAVTCQFENHIRAITGLPLGASHSYQQAVMFNLLGKIPEKAQLLSIPNLHLYDYQKTARAKRKMGHVIIADAKISLSGCQAQLAPWLELST